MKFVVKNWNTKPKTKNRIHYSQKLKAHKKKHKQNSKKKIENEFCQTKSLFLPYWHSGQIAASVSIYLLVAICQMFKSKQWKQQKYILFSTFKRFVWVLWIYNSMIDGYIRWMNDCIGNIANQKFISTIYTRRINGMRVLKCVLILIQHKSYFVSSYFFFYF